MKETEDFFDNGNWSRIESPFEPEKDFREGIRDAGFEKFDHFGAQRDGTSLELYIGNDGQWLVSLYTSTYCRLIVVADFPSLLMLIPQLLPWIRAANETRKLELIEEAADLLFGWRRTEGPLADCIEERRRQNREDSESLKAAQLRQAQLKARGTN